MLTRSRILWHFGSVIDTKGGMTADIKTCRPPTSYLESNV